MRKKGMVAIGRVVLSTREHIIALEARDAGILGMEYFQDMPEVDTPTEMIDLATHIIDTMTGHFDPAKFEDRYETAMRDLIEREQAGEKIVSVAHASPKTTVNLMEALRASLVKKRPPAASVQRRAGASAARRPTAKARSHTST
jgi:DNA end-binding protein Ku